MAYRVFLSSTSLDLRLHRRAAYDTLIEYGFVPIAMENFHAQSAEPIEVCLEGVRDCDLFLGLYALRYGHIRPGAPCSITEEEYNDAVARGRDRLCFLVDENWADWPAEWRDEGDTAVRLADFKKRLQATRMLDTFTTPESLASALGKSLGQWLQRQAPGGMSKLMGLVEQRCEAVLKEKTGPALVDLALEWRDRLSGPLHLDAPRDITESQLAECLRERSRLLITGSPGSGKTIALDRLARDLIAEIRRRPGSSNAVPVPLSLAAWETAKQRLSEYFLWKLVDDYGVLDKEAKSWVQDSRFLPLLDDLDRLDPEQRARCAEGLLDLARSQGGLVVAARSSAASEGLPVEQAGLQAEATLRPLEPEQVDAYLAAGGTGLEGLRAALRESPLLRRLACTPRLLNLLARIFRSPSAVALDGEALSKKTEERLAAEYVLCVEQDAGASPALRQRTRRYLAWLARGMRDNRMSRFEIDKLQPTWLTSPFERLLYAVLSRTVGGGVLTLLPALFLRSPSLIPCGLAMGALVGMIDALPVWRAPASRRARDSIMQTAIRIALITLCSLVVSWQIADLLGGPRLGVGYGAAVSFGLLFGVRPAGPREDVRFFDNVQYGFSWRGAWVGAVIAFPLPFLLGGLGHLLGEETVAQFVWQSWAVVGLLLGLLLFFVGGFLGGTEGSVIELRRRPKLHLGNILIDGWGLFWRVSLAAGVPLGIVIGLLELLARSDGKGTLFGWQGALAIPETALTTGLVAGFWLSGMDALQHFTLRSLLSASGRFPWYWVRFLDQAVSRELLLDIDGGYEFPLEPVRDFFEHLGETERSN